MAYLSPATLFAWTDFHLHIVTIRNHRGGHFYSKELSDQERVSLRKSGLGWPESIWTKRHSQDKHLQIEDIMSTKVTWSPPLSQFSLPLSSPLTVRLDPSAICTLWMYTTPSNCCFYPYICLWIKQIHQWHPPSNRNFPYKCAMNLIFFDSLRMFGSQLSARDTCRPPLLRPSHQPR